MGFFKVGFGRDILAIFSLLINCFPMVRITAQLLNQKFEHYVTAYHYAHRYRVKSGGQGQCL